jgi:hypothetical protein
MQAPAHLSWLFVGRQGVPSGAGWVTHVVPTQTAEHLESSPHKYPSKVTSPASWMVKQVICPVGLTSHTPSHSPSGPVPSGSQGSP